MKVLSLKEPFATLIQTGYKHIETRSWNTNYRGELYIHASGKNIDKTMLYNDFLKNIINQIPTQCGNIICKCNLTDCLYMDEQLINKVKENPIEYQCGDYQIGRYAWVLADITPIEPIPAKGHLGIWNHNHEEE